MVNQYKDGKALLVRFTNLMAAGKRCEALLFRDSLTAQELESFYGAMRTPWVSGSLGTNTAKFAITFALDEVTTAVELVRDMALIATAHNCTAKVVFDEGHRQVKLSLTGASEPVQRVLLSWLRGYTKAEGSRPRLPGMIVDFASKLPWSKDVTLSL